MNKKLPENAKKVFEGVIYDVYQWEQEMYDGSIETFERVFRNDTATVIAAVGDKIIILDQEQPYKGSFLALPGGMGEDGEDGMEVAKREFLEETGYVAKEMIFWKRCNLLSFNNDYYIARDCRWKQEQQLDNGEKIRVGLIDFEEFLMMSENENFRHKELMAELMRMRLHPEMKEEFRKLLFG